jgi:hypothetical protein
MARQRGLIKIEGTMGDMTFVKTQDGFLVKEKTTINGNRIRTEDSFIRTRENYTEFGRAAKAGKVLREAIRPVLKYAKDPRVTSRLTKQMMKVVKADATSTRGQRNVLDGETELLQDFQFNNNSSLSSKLHTPYTAAIDRVTGLATISIPAYTPMDAIVIPEGSTHYKIISAASEVDFENNTSSLALFESGFIVWNNTPQALMDISLALTPNSTHPLFLLLGLQFYQLVNGQQYSLKNGSFNALGIVKVEGV